MRVVHVVTRSHRRGAEVVALELADALRTLGHDNELYAIAKATDGRSVDGLPVLVAASHLGIATYVRSAWRMRRILARHPADIVLAHGGAAAIVVAVALPARAGARVWQRILGLPVERWGRVRRGAWRLVARRFHGVVALSKELEREVRQLGYRGPVWLIPNARDTGRFAGIDRAAAAMELRSQIGVAADVPLLGFVGHLVDQKQPELAVDVVALVRRSGQAVHLVVAGDGPRRALVEERIIEHGVADAVTMLGHRDDPEVIFGASDLALITSLAEGVPGVAIEAHMTGCPVVSFPVGSIVDVVDDGVTGVVLARADAALMAERVVELLSDRPVLRAMGRAAVTRGAAFSMSRAASLYATRFDELLSAASDTSGMEGSAPQE